MTGTAFLMLSLFFMLLAIFGKYISIMPTYPYEPYLLAILTMQFAMYFMKKEEKRNN